jgi:hypothetical protein
MGRTGMSGIGTGRWEQESADDDNIIQNHIRFISII